MGTLIINAEGIILGRVASQAAKLALEGNNVAVVNCGKALVTGTKENVINTFKDKRKRGSVANGPFIPRRPGMFVRRVIRGMLPFKKARGREAYKRISCYAGNPEIKGETVKVRGAVQHVSRRTDYGQVDKICRALGAK